MANVLIALGSNLGDSSQIVQKAISQIAQDCQVSDYAASRLHRTPPIGGPEGQGPFVNAAMVGDTSLEPRVVLDRLQVIERRFGRERLERWGPRTLDLDLILYGDRVLDEPGLIVPHPRMAWRRFVLDPAAEVAPGMVHPIFELSVAELKRRIDDACRPKIVVWGDTVESTRERRDAFEKRLVKRIGDSAEVEVCSLDAVGGSNRTPEETRTDGTVRRPNLYVVGPATPNPLYCLEERRALEHNHVPQASDGVRNSRHWTRASRISYIVQRYRTVAPILVLPERRDDDIADWVEEIVAAAASMR
ncbi:hypothetical protein JCM19992_29940 [Thermostilla marina]